MCGGNPAVEHAPPQWQGFSWFCLLASTIVRLSLHARAEICSLSTLILLQCEDDAGSRGCRLELIACFVDAVSHLGVPRYCKSTSIRSGRLSPLSFLGLDRPRAGLLAQHSTADSIAGSAAALPAIQPRSAPYAWCAHTKAVSLCLEGLQQGCFGPNEWSGAFVCHDAS
jgi:hypothetical protein